MELIRYMIFILILVGSTSIGFLVSNRYTYRLNELKEILNRINILENKIKFTHMPLFYIFSELAKIDNNLNIAKLFQSISINLKENSIQNSFDKAIKDNKGLLNLKEEDYKLLKDISLVLGKTDIEGQIAEIEQFKILLKYNITNAQKDVEKNSKMYRSLGTIAGLVIIIILM